MMAQTKRLCIASCLLFSCSATALNCSSEQVAAVKLVQHQQLTSHAHAGKPKMMGDARVQQTHFISVEGTEYIEQQIERQVPIGLGANGEMSFRWQALTRNEWRVGQYHYTASHQPRGDVYRKRRISPAKYNAAVAIEQLDATAANTAAYLGFRCQEMQQTLPNGGQVNVCNIRLYGRNIPLHALEKHPTLTRSVQPESLTQVCADRSVFAVPEYDWQ